MFRDGLANRIISKCDIYYKDALISKESIIERYMTFLADVISVGEHSVGFAMHTGSICFDIVPVVVLALGCLSYNTLDNDDVLSSLDIGKLVMYKDKKYRWQGISLINGKQYLVFEQDGTGKNGNPLLKVPYSKNKHLVKPYHGPSKRTDARGIRKTKSNREDFLSYFFDVPVTEVPSLVEVSAVIVADRSDFTEIYKHLKISYDNQRQIGLLDIVTAAYCTSSEEEHQFGENPTKSEPVLKVVGRISVARDLVLDKHGNKVIGLLVTDVQSLYENSSELADLLRRRNLKFMHVTAPIKLDMAEHVMRMYEDADIFACTKEYLVEKATSIKCSNAFTVELNRQIANIVNSRISTVFISNGCSWEEYRQIKSELLLLKQSNWENEQKNDFIFSALSLLNLFITAVFSMNQLEGAISAAQINKAVRSPAARIDELWSITSRAGAMEDRCAFITNALELQYIKISDESPKAIALKHYVEMHPKKKIVIIVPKAYYIDILSLTNSFNDENIICVTTSRFDITCEYDVILVVGDVSGRKFDPLQCYNAKDMEVLLYECECKQFNYRRRKVNRLERELNYKIGVIKAVEISADIMNEIGSVGDKVDDITIEEFDDLEKYIDGMRTFEIKKLISDGVLSGENAPLSEVCFVGSFVTGEQILFSKYYKAVVFSQEASAVKETAIEELESGDLLVFTKRDNYTKNIVDFIYEQLLMTGRLSQSVMDATEKVQYWKEVLRAYKNNGNYTYRDIAKKLQGFGSTLQEMAIRQWLMEDSHIVGPRDKKTMEYIAKTTQDPYLLEDIQGYSDACHAVRSQRREILKLIAKAINDRLSGHIPLEGSVLEVVYNNVESLSEILELETVLILEEGINVNINLVNRPITEMEVSM